MSRNRALPLLTFVTLAATEPVGATSYFVTQFGAGIHAGLSWEEAWSVGDYNASAAPSGGDTVFFSGAITSTVTPNTSGTNYWKVITLDFSHAVLTTPAISFGAKSNIKMIGGQIATDSGGKIIIYCTESSSNITISGFTFTGSPGNSGTDQFVQMSSGCNGITITGNSADNIAHGVVLTGGRVTNLTISNNFFRASTNTVEQTDILFLPDTNTVLIQGNKLIQQAPGQTRCCHNDVIQTFRSGAGAAINPTNWTVRYNWLQLNIDGGSGDNSWMEIENMTGRPALKVYGNVFVGTGGPMAGGNGISIHSGTRASDTYYFYNNTVYRHQQPNSAIRLGEGDGPGTLYSRNNIAAADTNCDCHPLQWTFTAGAQWNRNFFYNFDGATSTFSGPNGSTNTYPIFENTAANDFALQKGSPLIDAGDATIGPEFSQGIAPGATWPNPTLVSRGSGSWDVGAYQSRGGRVFPPLPPSSLTATPR